MTPPPIDPELLTKLRAAGIDPEHPQWVTTRSINLSDLPTMRRQRELLTQLRDVLKTQLDKEQARLDLALETYERLKNGGGL